MKEKEGLSVREIAMIILEQEDPEMVLRKIVSGEMELLRWDEHTVMVVFNSPNGL